MTNKSTKRALLTSVMALFLCFTMLLGTTFAWFTDSVTSAGNKIVAGTLDVKLLMYDGSKYVDISDSNDPIIGAPIFGEGANANENTAATLWEPGKTQTVYLAIENAGTLALKYQVALEVANIKNNLNEVVSYAITPDAMPGEITGWVGNGTGVELGVNSVATAQNVSLGAGDTHYFALSVHMDEEAGNEYQEGSIEFDIKLLATQLNYEEDSFGSDYDEDLTYPLGKSVTLSENSVEINVPSDAPKGNYELNAAKTNKSTVDGKTTIDYDITLYRDGVKVSGDGTRYCVYIDVGSGLIIDKVLHNGEEVTDYTYDDAEGILFFYTSSFSPFSIVYSLKEYTVIASIEEFNEKLADGGVFYITDEIDLATVKGEIVLTKDVEIYAEKDTTINFTEVAGIFGGKLKIHGGNIVAKKEVYVSTGAELVLDGGVYNFAALSAVGTGKITIEAGEVNLNATYAGIMSVTFGENGKLIVNGGTINLANPINLNPNRCDAAYVEINGGTFNMSTHADNLFVVRNIMDKDRESGVLRGSTIRINGGTFNATYQLDSDGDANAFIRNGDGPADTNKVLVSNTFNGEKDYDCIITGGNFNGCWQRSDNVRYTPESGNGNGDGLVAEITFAGFVADGYEVVGDAINGYTVVEK